MEFFREALSPAVFAKVVYIKEGELVPIDNASPLEKFVSCAGRRKRKCLSPTACARCARSHPAVPFAISPLWCWWAAHRWTLRSRSLSRKPCRTMAWSPGRAIFGGTEGAAQCGRHRAATGRSGELNGRSRQPLFNVLFQDADNEPDFYLNRAVRGRVSWHRIAHFLRRGLRRCAAVAGASFGQWEISIIWGLGVAMAIYLIGRCLRRAP